MQSVVLMIGESNMNKELSRLLGVPMNANLEYWEGFGNVQSLYVWTHTKGDCKYMSFQKDKGKYPLYSAVKKHLNKRRGI